MAEKEFSIKLNGVEKSYENVKLLKNETDKLERTMASLSGSLNSVANFSKDMFSLFKSGTTIISTLCGI